MQGSVRDSRNQPVAGATVYLRVKTGERTLTAHTDSEGRYRFSALRGGTYTLRAERSGNGEAAFGPFVLGQKETKKVNLTLEPAFFDEPNFIVAGVADATSSGGHGSDTVWRSADALAKATVSLSKESTGNGPPASPTEKLREAVERNPANAELHRLLGDAEETLGNPLEAVREYQRAAELDVSETNLFDWGAELLTHRADEPAIEVFAKGHRLFPRSVRVLLGLAVAWYSRSAYDQAAQYFFEACDLNPSDSRPYLFLGKVQSVEITQLDGFMDRLRRFARLQPDNALANYYYAVSLWKARKGPGNSMRLDEIRSLLEKAVRLDPNLSAGHLQLGILYSDRKEFPKAIQAYQRVIEINPRAEEAHYRLAQAYGRTGEKLQAQRELEIHDRLSKESAKEVERERREIQQFVFALRGPTSASRPQ